MGDPAHWEQRFPHNSPIRSRLLAARPLVHDIIDSETVEDRDRITLGTLAGIGIVKGEPFDPDERLQKIFVEADSRFPNHPSF